MGPCRLEAKKSLAETTELWLWLSFEDLRILSGRWFVSSLWHKQVDKSNKCGAAAPSLPMRIRVLFSRNFSFQVLGWCPGPQPHAKILSPIKRRIFASWKELLCLDTQPLHAPFIARTRLTATEQPTTAPN